MYIHWLGDGEVLVGAQALLVGVEAIGRVVGGRWMAGDMAFGGLEVADQAGVVSVGYIVWAIAAEAQ